MKGFKIWVKSLPVEQKKDILFNKLPELYNVIPHEDFKRRNDRYFNNIKFFTASEECLKSTNTIYSGYACYENDGLTTNKKAFTICPRPEITIKDLGMIDNNLILNIY